MVVHQDGGRGRLADDVMEHLARVHDRRGERTLRDAHILELLVLGVEQQHVKFLGFEAAELPAIVVVHVGAGPVRRAARHFRLRVPLGDLQRGLEARGFGGADAVDLAQLRDARFFQLLDGIVVSSQQLAAQVERRLVRAADPQ